MGKLIIITGAAGFIGRNVVAELNRRGRSNLLLVDALGHDEKWKNLRGLEFDDLVSPAGFLQSVQAGKAPVPDAIIHLGACSATTETNADFLLENNYRYSRDLCQWALSHGTRFVYASSAATYGDGALGYDDDLEKLDTLRPLNMYGYSKQIFDLWARRQGLFNRIVGLKYFNVYGPYEDHKADMRSVVQKAFHQIRSTGKIELFKSYRADYADGRQMRDFVYVQDAVDVTLHFVEQRGSGGLLNCGTGQARSWLDLAHSVFQAMGRAPQIDFIDMPESLRSKYQYFTQAQSSHLRQAGYTQPFTPLEEGVRRYVQDYLMLNPV